MVERVAEIGFRVLTLGGGDPTSYPYWEAMVRSAKALGLVVHIDTNGIGLRGTDREARTIDEAVDLLGLPLDGPTALVHDAVRGTSGHFELIRRRASWVQGRATALKLNTIVVRENAHAVPDMAPLIREIDPSRWSLYHYWPLGPAHRTAAANDVPDCTFAELCETISLQGPRSIIEFNPRRSRRLTYPIVTHDGAMAVHACDDPNAFLPLGSIFDAAVVERALAMCGPDREAAERRYASATRSS